MQLLCLGDVALADETVIQQVWDPLHAMIPGEETRILLNWELPIGDTINLTPRVMGPRLLAHPDSPNVIRRWSPGFATLATNHVLDAGAQGLAKTIESLNHLGFTTVGAGTTREEIERTLIWKTTEGRLAIINWVFPETHPDWMSIPGPNCWPGPEEARKAVDKVRGEADWVMVVVHWSDELFSYPRPEDRATASDLAHMGADLVIGHHPHVVRGMETIGTCPVFYSLGNFYFSDFPNCADGLNLQQAPRNREGLGIRIFFRAGRRPECQVLPLWQTNKQVVVDPLGRAARRLDRVSRPLRKIPQAEYTEWYTGERARFNRWGVKFHFGVRKLGLWGSIRYALSLMQRSNPKGLLRKEAYPR